MRNMKRFFQIYILILTVFFIRPLTGQTIQEIALEKGRKAIELTDKGEYDKSLELLEQAQALDPENYNYPYEIAYNYYVQKKYKKAIKVISKLTNYKGIVDNVYVLWGNSYDNLKKQNKALEIYGKGLEKFPYSGKLYNEIGISYLRSNELQKSIESFVKGIELNPSYPSNYYWASKIFKNSINSGWALIYGEIFMNLEPGSSRTVEVSQLLNEVYVKHVGIINDSLVSVDLFDKSKALDEMFRNYSADSTLKRLSFPLVYELFTMDAAQGETKINEKSIMRLRTKFVNDYFKKNYDKIFPNVLFNFQKKVMDSGMWDVYNTFIILQSNKEKFELWLEQNKTQWDEFVDWYNANSMKLNLGYRFYHNQYLRLQNK